MHAGPREGAWPPGLGASVPGSLHQACRKGVALTDVYGYRKRFIGDKLRREEKRGWGHLWIFIKMFVEIYQTIGGYSSRCLWIFSKTFFDIYLKILLDIYRCDEVGIVCCVLHYRTDGCAECRTDAAPATAPTAAPATTPTAALATNPLVDVILVLTPKRPGAIRSQKALAVVDRYPHIPHRSVDVHRSVSVDIHRYK